ncbi:MAG: hypothetical protein ACO1OK_13785 [Devosia sp.]
MFDLHTFVVAAMCVIVGLQSISFGLIGRRFASRYGFIPRSERFDRLLEGLTLERILLMALVLMGIGAGAMLWGLSEWAARDFGPLESRYTLRALVLAMTALVAGFQLMLSGFLSSMTNIPLREGRILPPDDVRADAVQKKSD